MPAMVDALWRTAYRAAFVLLRAWWFVRRPEVQGAYVAVWHDGRLLLIQNSYRPGETVPCGAIGRGESPRTAAARELAEEVGIGVGEDELRFAGEVVVDCEFKRDHAHFFELHLDAAPRVTLDNREVIAAAFVAQEHLDERPLVPHVRSYLGTLGTPPVEWEATDGLT